VKILITGHKGFIGQHLWQELAHHGHEVFGVDLARDDEGILETEVWADLGEEGAINGTLDFVCPDRVIHLAAQVGRVFGERDLRHTVDSNALMTTLLARECGEREIPVLYASSSEVYGDQGNATCNEEGPFAMPHNLYGLTKRWGEEALQLYAPDGLQIVRLSMPYGPGAPPGVGRRALDNILWQAVHGKRIPIHRGAERSWCWIGDTVAGIRLVLEAGERLPTGFGVYNIGRDDRRVSMATLAHWCCELVGAAPEALIDIVDPPAAQTVVKRLSTAKLRGLGWEPKVELDEGLPQVLKWVRKFDAEGNPT
jgi:UDP-glucuronate 4-epimerase